MIKEQKEFFEEHIANVERQEWYGSKEGNCGKQIIC